MTRKQWTKEDETNLINMRKEGVTYEEIAQKLGRSTNSVLMKGSRLMTPEMRQKEIKIWTNDEHFKLLSMVEEGFRVPEIANVLGRTDVAIKQKIAAFKKEGAIKHVNKTLDRSKPTTLYLVHFPEEDFYKVGITQQQITARFSGYPKYVILDSVEFEDTQAAHDTEAEILSKLENYVPECFGKHNSGKTECFRADYSANSMQSQQLKLEDLF